MEMLLIKGLQMKAFQQESLLSRLLEHMLHSQNLCSFRNLTLYDHNLLEMNKDKFALSINPQYIVLNFPSLF